MAVGALAPVLTLMLCLTACSPTLNWRDVRPEGTQLNLLLPCKPDKAQKLVPLGGQPTQLRMLGCDAGGLTFAVSVADIKDAAAVPATLVAWQQLTLSNMKAVPGHTTAPLKLPGANGAVAVRFQAKGQRMDGSPVMGHAAYFAQGATVFQAVIYGADIQADIAETYFSGLKFE